MSSETERPLAVILHKNAAAAAGARLESVLAV
jgi:hypothetical protein